MRIAYICADPGIPVFGSKGCSIHVQEVLRSLRKLGHEVILFATRLGDEPPADLASLPVRCLPAIPKGERYIREKIALAVNPDLKQDLELAGNFDLIYERYSLWSYSGMEYAREKGIPGILEVNAPLIEEQDLHRGLVDREAAQMVARLVFGAASAIVAVSAQVKDYLGNYVSAAKVFVIPNGINRDRFAFPLVPAINYPTDNFVVGFVGSLKPWHGLSSLTEAFALFHQKVPSSRLLIIGNGPERGKIEADLSLKDLSHAADFTGAVAPDRIPNWLAVMAVAVAPYENRPDFYFSPLKVYEYMAAGLPVVTSRIGQLSEVIEDGENGLLYPPGNAVALAEALEKLWRSPSLRARMGAAGRETVLKDRTWDAIAQQILDLGEESRLVAGVRSKE